MSRYRRHLPQLDGSLYLTDGGLETTLIFHEGMDLPCFAAFDLLRDEAGTETLRRYYARYVEIALEHGAGFVLEAPTWRANRDWAQRLGYDDAGLEDANRMAIGLMLDIRAAYETRQIPIVVSGNVGPRGDGYSADARMYATEARDYHARQIGTFAGTEADMVSALTMTYIEEAVGIVQAAHEAAMPVAISFTLETDGRLPSGDTLADAIRLTDDETGGYAAYYMINCAHPTHFAHVLRGGGSWRERIRGLRANASSLSHAELDACTELDAGNPQELGGQYHELGALLPKLAVLGGCCGTDHRHVEATGSAFAR